MKASPVLDALDADSYQWMSVNAPELLAAIEQEVAGGAKPESLRLLVAAHVGPERNALAVRVGQAARHIQRTMRG